MERTNNGRIQEKTREKEICKCLRNSSSGHHQTSGYEILKKKRMLLENEKITQKHTILHRNLIKGINTWAGPS